ncbi:MAG: hypothetical protein A2Z20_03845 [Bdellovibrionales bacterium RBG_16_40_8]|nr:MAG: hypothetical protein A2Z20_03845 [Bdellovibrionales bacterium RBG_16_40_8]
MWFVKFLSGPLSGQSLPLKSGLNVVGRAHHCDVVIPSANISKEHAQIDVYPDKIIISDMNSRNGSFVNGLQITRHKLRSGERISLFDVIFEISEKLPPNQRIAQSSLPMAESGNLAYNQLPGALTEATPGDSPELVHEPSLSPSPTTPTEKNLATYLQKYLDEVVMPGVYKIPEWMEFRLALGLFVAIYVIGVTALSTIPLVKILKASVEKEAQNRAQTIARSLARDNKNAIMQGQFSLVTTEYANSEPGANSYVISNINGDVLAPPQLAGQYLTDIDFVNEARKLNSGSVKQIDASTIVAVEPIQFYDSRTGSNSTAAHAVVKYNMGTLAVDDGRTLSLVVQVLFIAALSGGLLYFFLYKVILHPINSLNDQISTALRDGSGHISTSFQFPELQKLATNINSAIHRGGGGGFATENLQDFEADRSLEMLNIIKMVGFAAITVNTNTNTIAAANDHFISQIGQNSNWNNLPVDNILDQALKLNIRSLVDRVQTSPSQIMADQLEVSNCSYDIAAQGIMGSKNLAYVLIAFIPRTGGE